MKPPSGSCCPGWHTASIALSITGVSTRIGRLVRTNDACSGSSHLVTPQRFLSASGRIAQYVRPRRHLLSASAYRQAMSQRFERWAEITARSGLPQKQGGPGSRPRVPDDDISLNKSTIPSPHTPRCSRIRTATLHQRASGDRGGRTATRRGGSSRRERGSPDHGGVLVGACDA
jgi:hypothetical protein